MENDFQDVTIRYGLPSRLKMLAPVAVPTSNGTRPTYSTLGLVNPPTAGTTGPAFEVAMVPGSTPPTSAARPASRARRRFTRAPRVEGQVSGSVFDADGRDPP